MENGNDKLKRLQAGQERLLNRLRQSLLETYNAAIEIGSVKKAISSGNDGFFFANDDIANKAIDKQLSAFAKQMNYQLLNGIEKSWEQGKESIDKKLQTVMPKDKNGRETFEQIKKTAEQSNRANAAKAFYNEKRSGFNISERIWNLAGNAKKEIEIILQNGIKEGKSADEIQKSLKGYLNAPDKLFHRVRNKGTDKLEWSQAAQKYHPGRGVYRSAYKNIMRLVRTELKAANCESVWQSMQSNPLITGYMIVLSNNHTTLSNGKKIPLKDICDDLHGTYPKSFKFRGWHPQCRCEMLPIMATSDERKDLYKKIFDNKRDEWKPKPIEDVPSGFKDWVEANKGRQKSGGNVPYFVRDNFIDGQLCKGLAFATKDANVIPQQAVENAKDTSSTLDEVVQLMAKAKVDYNEVKPLSNKLTETDIIARVGGGDLTKGSCSSLAFTYAGNKCGLDVLDFRDGSSRQMFCSSGTIMNIAKKVGGVIVEHTNDFSSATELLKHTQVGKEYYFTCGAHAAIVRKTATGYEYLELQSATKNGFKALSTSELRYRFGAKRSHTMYGTKYKTKECIIDIELLKNNTGFQKLLGYINTNESKQRKGQSGTMK